jgi:hypothetical protein
LNGISAVSSAEPNPVAAQPESKTATSAPTSFRTVEFEAVVRFMVISWFVASRTSRRDWTIGQKLEYVPTRTGETTARMPAQAKKKAR